jgi:hypothetical protein
MDRIKPYNIFINESLKDKLKGKSDDDIRVSIENSNLNFDEKLKLGIKHKLEWLVNDSKKDIIDYLNENKNILNNIEKMDIGCRFDLPWLVEESIECGLSPDYNDNYPLALSSNHGCINVVKLLIDKYRVKTDYRSLSWAKSFNRYFDNSNLINILKSNNIKFD